MTQQIQLNRPEFTLQPGADIKLPIVGDFVHCDLATLPFKIVFDEDQETTFEQGFELRPATSFRRVQIINPNDAEIAVKLSIGYGGVENRRMSIAGKVEVIEDPTTEMRASPTVTVPPGGTEQALPANTARREFLVRNLSETERLWLAGATGQGQSGVMLEPGELFGTRSTGALFVHNPGGTSAQVSVIEGLI